jgi:hypothetical protein
MRRLHLFEFTDMEWFPAVLRSSALAFLSTLYRLSGAANQALGEKLASVLQAAGSDQILDLASGATGPVLHLLPTLQRRCGPVQVTLSDRFPAQSGQEKVAALGDPAVRYLATPVDATAAPAELAGVRTIFGAFHHFPPELARRVLRDAFQQRRAIAIFEVAARKPVLVLSGLFMPLMVLLLTPLVRPLRASQLLLTYVLPILPLLIAWDGIVSVLRTYTPEELRAMTAELSAADYRWEIGELALKGVPTKVPYLIGSPLR